MSSSPVDAEDEVMSEVVAEPVPSEQTGEETAKKADEDEQSAVPSVHEEEDDISVSHNPGDDDASSSPPKTPKSSESKEKPTKVASSAKKGRTPSVSGLTIPFRTVKKVMKLDPDIPIVQNEAAIMTTVAVELFLKNLAKDSFRKAKARGRNTVRYEDIAEARTASESMSFLDTLLP